jgi:hypothetical protein
MMNKLLFLALAALMLQSSAKAAEKASYVITVKKQGSDETLFSRNMTGPGIYKVKIKGDDKIWMKRS